MRDDAAFYKNGNDSTLLYPFNTLPTEMANEKWLNHVVPADCIAGALPSATKEKDIDVTAKSSSVFG